MTSLTAYAGPAVRTVASNQGVLRCQRMIFLVEYVTWRQPSKTLRRRLLVAMVVQVTYTRLSRGVYCDTLQYTPLIVGLVVVSLLLLQLFLSGVTSIGQGEQSPRAFPALI